MGEPIFHSQPIVDRCRLCCLQATGIGCTGATPAASIHASMPCNPESHTASYPTRHGSHSSALVLRSWVLWESKRRAAPPFARRVAFVACIGLPSAQNDPRRSTPTEASAGGASTSRVADDKARLQRVVVVTAAHERRLRLDVRLRFGSPRRTCQWSAPTLAHAHSRAQP